MKILGASGLTVGDDALNKIPEQYLDDGDACVALYDNKFYWYELSEYSGVPENLPTIVEPLYGGSDKRWLLRNIFLTELEVQTVYTNSVQQLSGGSLDLNGVASLSGDTFTFTNLLEAPFIVNSTTMVDNLNAEYWGGVHFSDFDLNGLIVSGDQFIPQGIDELYVPFPEQRFSVSYTLFTELYNTQTTEPSIINYIVTDKTFYGFTIKLSASTDNPTYRLQWAILGTNDQSYSNNLIDESNNFITDDYGNQITVVQ